MKGLLEFLGVILFLCFCGTGVYILVNFSTVEQIEGYYYTYTTTVTNWNAIAIGIGLIVQGLFSLAVAFVLSGTLANTSNIISLLKSSEGGSSTQTEKVEQEKKEIEEVEDREEYTQYNEYY